MLRDWATGVTFKWIDQIYFLICNLKGCKSWERNFWCKCQQRIYIYRISQIPSTHPFNEVHTYLKAKGKLEKLKSTLTLLSCGCIFNNYCAISISSKSSYFKIIRITTVIIITINMIIIVMTDSGLKKNAGHCFSEAEYDKSLWPGCRHHLHDDELSGFLTLSMINPSGKHFFHLP